MSEKFDAIVVGAGPAGNAAAIVMAREGLSVLLLERGEYPGSKNVMGAVLYSNALEKILPDFRKTAPLERHIIDQKVWMLSEKGHVGGEFRSDEFNVEKPDRYSIIRAQFDRWFANQAKEAGALLICDTVAKKLLRDEKGKVIGVSTDREGGDIYADIVVLADGVNSMLAREAGFRSEVAPDHAALICKEMHFLPPDVIESRFNIRDRQGVAFEIVGSITQGKIGLGFLYTNKESISIGIGCMVSDFQEGGLTPYGLLDNLKEHPSIKPLLEGSEMKEYAAHLIPEGGYNSIPKIYGDGWVLVGDSAGLVNAIHREGSNLAMTSGRIAGELITMMKKNGLAFNEHNLAAYRKSLEESFVLKDLKKYRGMPAFLENNRHLFTLYPELLSKAAMTMLKVDDQDKKSKEREVFRSFRQARGIMGLLGDAFKFMRAFR